MFDNKIKELSINIYKYLKIMGIIGQERINFITNNFKCHITTFYNWNKEYNDNFNNIYQNKNINPLIVNDILIYCKNNKNVNIKILKNYINKNHNTKFSSNTIIFILKINNLKYKNHKINDEIIKFILNTVEKNNVITVKEIISLINKNFNLLISESSIYNILKKNKITYKRVTIKTNPYTEEEEKETLNNIKYILDELEPNNIISYDEISVTNNEYPVFGWSKSGEKCIVKNRINNIKGDRFSIGLAINNKKIVGYKIVDKGFKTDDFIDIMKDLKEKDINNEYSYFLDNASVHKTKKFKDYTKESKIHVLYNAPYNSEKNPVEYVFASLRRYIQNNIFKTINELDILMKEYINNSKESLFTNCFSHAFSLF